MPIIDDPQLISMLMGSARDVIGNEWAPIGVERVTPRGPVCVVCRHAGGLIGCTTVAVKYVAMPRVLAEQVTGEPALTNSNSWGVWVPQR